MKTRPETMGEQHERVLEALAELEVSASAYVSEQPGWARQRARNRLATAALTYAARVRRLAGVR